VSFSNSSDDHHGRSADLLGVAAMVHDAFRGEPGDPIMMGTRPATCSTVAAATASRSQSDR